MITIQYMQEIKIEPEREKKLEQEKKPESRISSKCDGNPEANGQLVRCRIGRFPWEYGILRKQEKMLAAKMQELQLVIYELPSRYAPKKKRQLIEAVRKQTGDLWLEERLVQKLHEAEKVGNVGGIYGNKFYCEDFLKQPEAPPELIRFRVCVESEAWQKHCRQKGGEFESLVVWNAGSVQGSGAENTADAELWGKDEKEAFAELLFSLTENVNFFTIIGAGTQDYKELAERLFMENGLPVRFLEKAVRGYPYGPAPLILGMDVKRRIRRDVFRADAKCLDLYAGMPKFLDTIARNGYNT